MVTFKLHLFPFIGISTVLSSGILYQIYVILSQKQKYI